jgi:hypothetical protein
MDGPKGARSLHNHTGGSKHVVRGQDALPRHGHGASMQERFDNLRGASYLFAPLQEGPTTQGW